MAGRSAPRGPQRLRPARYLVTEDDLVVMASESGVLPEIADSRIVKKWRLQPGKMFLIDLEQGRIIDDSEIKAQLAASKPYRQWIDALRMRLDEVAGPDDDSRCHSRRNRCWTASRPSATRRRTSSS